MLHFHHVWTCFILSQMWYTMLVLINTLICYFLCLQTSLLFPLLPTALIIFCHTSSSIIQMILWIHVQNLNHIFVAYIWPNNSVACHSIVTTIATFLHLIFTWCGGHLLSVSEYYWAKCFLCVHVQSMYICVCDYCRCLIVNACVHVCVLENQNMGEFTTPS